ncbi:SH3 domain-containing protein [Streptomyces hoynatensis]|uniref:SH3 domain-containing protein n=2 Tax=Streptomyces hoynatensis TaxID=1141874 RepID=A0A3A9YSM0_9ACTN|nr:SH3 domain-containing protein [Streptomyces hoynatensis]
MVFGLSTLFLAVGLGAAPSAVADAEDAAVCTHPSWSNKDSGVDYVRAALEEAPIRTGPNSGCGVVGMARYTDKVYLHCYTYNSAGNTWSHVRAVSIYDGREISGWIWDSNLVDHGSTQLC